MREHHTKWNKLDSKSKVKCFICGNWEEKKKNNFMKIEGKPIDFYRKGIETEAGGKYTQLCYVRLQVHHNDSFLHIKL